MNTPVSFELAKLLKEKGFDRKCRNFYYTDSDEILESAYCDNHNNASVSICSAPTIAEAVMWLYENHKIWVSILSTNDLEMFSYKIASKQGQYYSSNYDSIIEAYEVAIIHVLEELIYL
jgi:hypothetical protein